MPASRRLRTTVQSGGRIELSVPDLAPGKTVDVIIVNVSDGVARRPLNETLARTPGHRLFRTAQEVDEHIRAERDAWQD